MRKQDIIDGFGDDLENVLFSSYIEEQMSTTKIANMLTEFLHDEVNAGNVWILLKHFDIPVRSISDGVSQDRSFLDAEKSYIVNEDILNAIDGLLLSDASITKCGRYHRFSIGGSHREFIDFCYKYFSDMCYNEPQMYDNTVLKNGRRSSWCFVTGAHPDFTKQYNRWYDERGKKIIPSDISLSPLTVKLWYYGDGSLVNNFNNNTCMLRLSTDDFDTYYVDMVRDRLLKELGVDSVQTKEHRIRLKTGSIPIFMRYIGTQPELSCYSYKFMVPEWRFWTPMKKVAKELSIPYDRLSYLVKIGVIDHSRSPGGKKVMFNDNQMKLLKQMHKQGLLTADARKSNISIAKSKFNQIPYSLQNYIDIIRKNGFPYVDMSGEQIKSEFNNLFNVPMITLGGRDFDANYRNNDLAINFHRHLYNVICDTYKAPLEAFEDDEIMTDIVQNSLKKHESLSGQTLRNRICHYKGVKRTSVFPVRVAKTLIAKFGCQDMNMLDPCAGYSSRLIGFMGQGYEGEYIGIEPCKETYRGLHETYNTVQKHDQYLHSCKLFNDCAEDILPDMAENRFDLIFTSPPYFHLEKYDDNHNQSYLRYPDYEMWLDKFLFEIIRQGKRLMKTDGTFLLNISNCRNYKIVDDVDVFVKKHFRVQNVLLMHSPSPFMNSIMEPIFVLKKD